MEHSANANANANAKRCRLICGCKAQDDTSLMLRLRFMRGIVVQDQMQRDPLRYGASIFFRNLINSLARWRGRHSPMTMPDLTSRAANSVVVPLLL